MRPNSEWVPSPNFRLGDASRAITCVVMHATATKAIESPLSWLCRAGGSSSAHYLIGLDGRLVALVKEKDVAWHAGVSFWNGKKGVNGFSVGIELVNDNTGTMSYPEAQVAVAVQLVAAICLEHGIAAKDVMAHADLFANLSPEEMATRLREHADPRGFQMEDFRARLRALGVA